MKFEDQDQSTDVRQLRKSKGPLAGVCGGLGEYTGIPPIIIRIAFISFPFFVGWRFALASFVVYIILAIFLPKSNREHLRQFGKNQGYNSLTPKSTNTCSKCGKKNARNRNFCIECGEELF